MNYWTGFAIIKQAAAEMGIPIATSIEGTLDVATN